VEVENIQKAIPAQPYQEKNWLSTGPRTLASLLMCILKRRCRIASKASATTSVSFITFDSPEMEQARAKALACLLYRQRIFTAGTCSRCNPARPNLKQVHPDIRYPFLVTGDQVLSIGIKTPGFLPN
jgi:hypothetical protein